MGARVFIVVINAAMGACFTMLAAASINAAVAPVRRFHISSVVIAAVACVFAFLAFRAAATAETDEETVVSSLRAAIFGAILALVIMVVLLFMFGDDTRAFLAHAFSNPTSNFTTSRVLIATAILGFGTGLVVGMSMSQSSTHNRVEKS
jgi:cell division protein FtsW (lipid II flippase)